MLFFIAIKYHRVLLFKNTYRQLTVSNLGHLKAWEKNNSKAKGLGIMLQGWPTLCYKDDLL